MAELTVNLEAVLRNYRRFAKQGPVIPVLKDNAYGLGMQQVQSLLRRAGVTLFACSTPEEALRLSGDGADVLLLSCVHEPELLRRLAERDVILAVESLDQARAIEETGLPARVHLLVDTGFGRFGFLPGETEDMKAVFTLPHVRVTGIFSHFSSPAAAAEQFAAFAGVLDELRDYDIGLRHIAATSTAMDPRYRLDAVRIGTGLTGRYEGLEPSAELTARICTVRRLPRGSRVGYGGARLHRDTDVAIVDAGTADGAFLRRCCGFRSFLRSLHRRVSIGGWEVPVLGCPGLTHTAIDVTGVPCAVGDRVCIPQTPVLVSPAVPRRYT